MAAEIELIKIFKLFIAVALLLSIVSVSFADGIRVPIDLHAMEKEELLALADELSAVLAEHGYPYGIKDAESATESAEQSEEDADEKADENVAVTMDEGAKELSDESFLEDLSAALSARWTSSGEDTSLYSDKQYIEYMTQLVLSVVQSSFLQFRAIL